MRETERLIVEQVPRLRRYARALTGDAVLADDLVQDAVERALRHQRRWRAGTDMRAWLFTIMHNCFISGLRRARSNPAAVAVEATEAALSVPSPEAGLRDLIRAITGLSVEHRSVLLLVALEGLTYAEAATVLDVPTGTVMSRLARARARLRESLDEDGLRVVRRVK